MGLCVCVCRSMTDQIWRPDQASPVADLREHVKEIYSIRWSPTGPGTESAERKKLLAR